MQTHERLSCEVTLTLSVKQIPLTVAERQKIQERLREIADNWEGWILEQVYDAVWEDKDEDPLVSVLYRDGIEPGDDVITNA